MKVVVLSHTHFDHAENAAIISERFDIPVAYHKADDEIFDNYDAQPLNSYGLVGFVVLKMSLKVLRNTRVKRPEKHVYINEGDALDSWIMPGVGHLYYDLEEQKKTADKIRSYGRRTIYYGHGKPTDKF